MPTYTAQPIRLRVPFGEMEKRPRLSDKDYAEILTRNRLRFCAPGAGHGLPGPKPLAQHGFKLGRQEVL